MLRYLALIIALACTVVSGVLVLWSNWFLAPLAIAAALSAMGIHDMLQTKHSLKRNYPILANMRFSLEARRRVSARQGAARQAALRHAAGCLWRRLRVDQSFAGATPGPHPRFPRDRRRAAMQAALFDVALQHFGDEL